MTRKAANRNHQSKRGKFVVRDRNRWGPPVDDEIWNCILQKASEKLLSRLRECAIREVAAVSLERTTAESEQHQDIDYVAEILSEWFVESFPLDHDVASIVGDHVYSILDAGFAWNEQPQLAGEACPSAGDVARDLRDYFEQIPDAHDALTEELIEDFFQLWRTRFFLRILSEVEELGKVAQTIREAAQQKIAVPESSSDWKAFALTLNGETIAQQLDWPEPGNFDVDLAETFTEVKDKLLKPTSSGSSFPILMARMDLYNKVRYLDRMQTEPTTKEMAQIEQLLHWLRAHVGGSRV